MNYNLHTLSNGIRVLIVPMTSLESVTTTVWVKTGSRNEDKNINGISHFLEHMVFKGSEKRPGAKLISEAVDSIGGEFNAATNKDWTNFYIKSRPQNLEVAMDVLSDMVLHPILDKEEIEREKGTIVQELNMYEDTPMIKIGDVFEELIFDKSSLGWDVGGVEKTVRSITKNDFLRYRDIHYYPENMLVSISGGVSEKTALELTKKYFGHVACKPKLKFKVSDFKSEQVKSKFRLKTKKNEQAHFILGFVGDGRNYKNKYSQSVLSSILGGGMSSRLFIEVRERRGLAYSVRSLIERYQEVGYIGAYAGVDPKKVNEAIAIVLEQHYNIANKTLPISNEELAKSKEYLKGHLALGLEDTGAVGEFFAFQELFSDTVRTPEEVYQKIDEVTLDDVYFEAKRLFVPEKLNLAVIGPYKDESKFKKLLI
ncbi:MAG TPA: pitrilysin family protein [Alphaproteobacteria bacterium]|jgi:predicted Zn-dependent peptidase|nr:pitrilysin family protein [Alphaproteobacteria bacterium]